MPSNHLILCQPRLLLPSIFPSIRVFSSESVICIRWPDYQSFSFSISPPKGYSGLISKGRSRVFSKPQFKSINSSALSFFTVQLSHPYMTTGKTIALTKWTFVGGVMSLFFYMLFRLIIAFLPRSKHLLIGYRNSKLWDISFQRNKMKIRLDEKEQSDREQGSIKSHFKSPQNLQNFAASI